MWILLPADNAWATLDTGNINPRLLRLLQPVGESNSPDNAVVSNVIVSSVGENYAVLEWETDIAVTEEIYYGYFPSQSIPLLSLKNDTHHKIIMGNLLRGTEYHFRITGVEDYTGTLTTAGVPPPLYEEFGVKTPDAHTAVVSWATNVPTSYVLGFRRADEEDYSTLFRSSVARLRQSVTINDLVPLQKYFFIVESAETSGYKVNSGERVLVMPENNVALHKPATGSFLYFPPDPYVQRDTDPLVNVNDGDDAYFTGMATSGDVREGEQWVTIDLGREYDLQQVVTVWRQLAYPLDFAFYGSYDGEEWELLAEHLTAADGESGRSKGGDPILTQNTDLAGESCRYLKLVVPLRSALQTKYFNWHFVQLMELKVYPTE